MIEEKISRVKKLIEQRERIDAELASLFGISEQAKRGRPRKEQGSGSGASTEQRPAPEPTEPNSAGG